MIYCLLYSPRVPYRGPHAWWVAWYTDTAARNISSYITLIYSGFVSGIAFALMAASAKQFSHVYSWWGLTSVHIEILAVCQT